MQTSILPRHPARQGARHPGGMCLIACVFTLTAGCQGFLQRFAIRPSLKAHPAYGKALSARGYVMLVESDIKKGVRGILP